MVNISDICVSVWGHVGRLPGDVHTVWLRHPLLLGLSSGRLLCSVEQCGRDQEWRIQTLYDLSETIWENCGKHRNVAGMAAVHVTEQTSNSLGSQVFTLSWQLHSWEIIIGCWSNGCACFSGKVSIFTVTSSETGFLTF